MESYIPFCKGSLKRVHYTNFRSIAHSRMNILIKCFQRIHLYDYADSLYGLKFVLVLFHLLTILQIRWLFCVIISFARIFKGCVLSNKMPYLQCI